MIKKKNLQKIKRIEENFLKLIKNVDEKFMTHYT